MTSAYKRKTKLKIVQKEIPKSKFDEFVEFIRSRYSLLSEGAQADIILQCNLAMQDAYHRGFAAGLIKRK